jgi:hypothetical protein
MQDATGILYEPRSLASDPAAQQWQTDTHTWEPRQIYFCNVMTCGDACIQTILGRLHGARLQTVQTVQTQPLENILDTAHLFSWRFYNPSATRDPGQQEEEIASCPKVVEPLDHNTHTLSLNDGSLFASRWPKCSRLHRKYITGLKDAQLGTALAMHECCRSYVRFIGAECRAK